MCVHRFSDGRRRHRPDPSLRAVSQSVPRGSPDHRSPQGWDLLSHTPSPVLLPGVPAASQIRLPLSCFQIIVFAAPSPGKLFPHVRRWSSACPGLRHPLIGLPKWSVSPHPVPTLLHSLAMVLDLPLSSQQVSSWGQVWSPPGHHEPRVAEHMNTLTLFLFRKSQKKWTPPTWEPDPLPSGEGHRQGPQPAFLSPFMVPWWGKAERQEGKEESRVRGKGS